MWVSQMLAILDKPEAPAVHAILEDLTSQYPQVRYSLILQGPETPKWVLRQAMKTQMKCCMMQHFIKVCIVC